nr:hypothetical protein [uncultured Pedobacter sp.]
MKKLNLLILLIIMFNLASHAQTDSLTKKHSFFRLATAYLSNNAYMGRQSETVQSYITPSIGFYHKSGLFINAATSYIPNNGYQQFDMKELNEGYEISKGNFYGSATATQFFFNDSSTVVNSAINSMVGLSSSYDFNFITASASVDFNFLSRTDAVVEAGLSHSFSVADDKLSISPAVNLFAGTQNFYQAYYKPFNGSKSSAASRSARISSSKGKSTGKGKGTTQNTTTSSNTIEVQNYNQFKVMDCELSVNEEYEYKNFMFSLSPVYVIPVNPSSLVVNNVIVPETLKHIFKVEMGVCYKF